MKGSPRRLALLAVAAIATLAIAIPVIAADPSSSPPGQTKPEKSPKPGKSGNPGQEKKAEREKAPKTPEVDVIVEGTVQQSTDTQGRPTFTLTAAGKTWELSAGPPWYWGDKNPLKAFVGKSVKIAGSTHEGSTELDVETVDGTAIRAAGKPPWAGGPWAVGSIHPGWKPWMADGKPGRGLGRDGAPGQKKDKAAESPENEQPGS
jgi:hypothetical protein